VSVSSLALDDLVSAFIACGLPRVEWTHLAHLRVGAWHVHHEGRSAALASLRARIRKLNEHHGTPNSATSGYHETITVAYVHLIDEFLSGFPVATPLPTRVAVLASGPLADKDLLLAFWSRELLFSERARSVWVPPDRAPLRVPDEARPTRGGSRVPGPAVASPRENVRS
jgi:hypothetical protein